MAGPDRLSSPWRSCWMQRRIRICALRHYQDFKWRYVAVWKGDRIELPIGAIIDFVKSQGEIEAAFDRDNDDPVGEPSHRFVEPEEFFQ